MLVGLFNVLVTNGAAQSCGGEGIQVTSNRVLSYEYIVISVPHRNPVMIQQWTPIPNEAVQIGLFVLFYELSHPTLGQGTI